ncbi:alkaline phosphatase [Rhizobium halophytocola]|uniref:Alkaline phosphatase n=1 Tax=Rhizobium halophytocola TaxID=735519 RepID=A0ABS4E0E2_9HYPH|nr:alkaline phosphatase [Rhizobium halophytocola]MBP1851374.1 alkaline phosphatase [Rhizobium halophytocola]
MRTLFAALVATTALVGSAHAATVYPLDRATILSGSPFDFKVEFDAMIKPEDVKVTVNGEDYKSVLGSEAEFVAEEKGKDDKALGSALVLRGVKLSAGTYTVEAKAGDESKSVTWDVYATPDKPVAKNVIFFLGDGLSVAHRTAARIMSKGMTEGKANGRLAMDDLDHMAFIGTSATNSINTDSANTMSAYMTGHKSAINAIGVYADRTADPFDDPKVENIAEALRRTTKKSIGIVAKSELEDATPAAVVSHTRLRDEKAAIVGMMLDVKPEVALGGGSAYFLNKETPGSKRKDDKDYIKLFQDAGYTIATNSAELEKVATDNPEHMLGLFHTGNMDYALDRLQLKKGSVDKFPDQPGLVEMTKVALAKLDQNPDGFFLMVEGSDIDKASHPLDMERAVYDTIEFDQAIGIAREYQKDHPDTLIVVTGDHTHGVTLMGMIDNTKGETGRESFKVGAAAGFPTYTDEDHDGFPDKVDADRRLAMFVSNFPDHYETFQPKMDGPFEPAVKNEKGEYIANEAYKDVPGAIFEEGNLPKDESTGTHSVDDVVLQAAGPGADGFKGYMEESDVYKVMVDALALGAAKTN